MMGRNHLICGTALGAASLCAVAAGSASGGILAGACGEALKAFIPDGMSLGFSNGILHESVIYSVLACGLFLFGCLLPDVDSEKSTLGRHFHLPLQHRTWTHCFIACVLVFLPCLLHPLFRFMFAGFLSHILLDSLSAAGICFFYPFRDYIRYDSGAFIAPGHTVKLYRAGNTSETVCAVLIVVICVVICFASGGIPVIISRLFP